MVIDDIRSAIRFAAVWISGQFVSNLYPEVDISVSNISGQASHKSAESVLFCEGAAFALGSIRRVRFLLIPQATSLLW